MKKYLNVKEECFWRDVSTLYSSTIHTFVRAAVNIIVKLHICKFVIMLCTEYVTASGSICVSCFKNITYFQRAMYTDIGHPKRIERSTVTFTF